MMKDYRNRGWKPCNELKLYFIQSKHGGPVKVGLSVNIPKRIKELQTASPVALMCLGQVNGATKRLEEGLHSVLKKYWIRGEWFAEEILINIKELENQIVAHWGDAPIWPSIEWNNDSLLLSALVRLNKQLRS